MNAIDKDKKIRIVLNLISFKNKKVKNHITGLNIAATKLLTYSSRQLENIGFKKSEIDQLYDYSKIADEEIKIAEDNQIELIFHEDDNFPPLLKEIYRPPEYLYVKGKIQTLSKQSLSVVGSRKASLDGLSNLSFLLEPVVKAGIVIVSGMAYGSDVKAHQIAINNQGLTVGVNPGGLLNLYPRGNRNFLKQIFTYGCVISEFPLKTVPRPQLFPVRNRIITGLSKALLVSEAALKSGSLISAGFALEQNRDVYAIPGNINLKNSEGTNRLIQHGAKLILNPGDILEEFGLNWKKKDQKLLKISDVEKKLLDLMDRNSVKNIDYFVANTGLPVSTTISALIGMKLKDLIHEEQGGYKKLL